MTEAVCEEHHIPLTLHIGLVEEVDEDAGEVGEYLACRLCVALDAVYDRDHRIIALTHDNHRLRAAIGRHRDRIMSLGHDGKGKHGSEWDRELWSVLYDFLRADPFGGCTTYIEHGACVCSTGYPANCTADHDDPSPECAQEFAGFGPPCSDPMCEACHNDDPSEPSDASIRPDSPA